jgi:hypothetical protein
MKLRGLGKHRKLRKWKVLEVLNDRDFVRSSNSKIGNTKKLWMREMGNPTAEERGVPVSYSRRSGLCRCSCRSSHYAKE